ncbi:transport and Golgi organization protein 1 homolog isoform X3 [Ursus arctos]|uniref:transport and Golgi organization protein 1 homolog isoform X3 n=1 Tax=Ursus arctos TaxID=9644 RepID=UPI0025492340|nr:transport and Golgi organization protein 1 homolog isoform X3 [Ursus arctos]
MFIAELSTIAKSWKEPRCPSTDDWIKKLWSIYTMEYYSAIRKNEFSTLTATWTALQETMLSEISQAEKELSYGFSHLWKIRTRMIAKGRKLVHVVPDRFILGLDGAGVLWNFAILTGYLGICAFLIYIWRTVLAIAPRQYEVTLQQIAEKIHRLKNENRELAKEISIWEEKIRERKKHRAEMKREHQFLSDKILKLKENIGKVERVNANLSVALHFKRTMLQAMREKNVKNEDMAQDALEDEEQGDLESKKRVLKESKKVLEQKCNALSSLKAAKEVELKLLRKKLGIVVDFSERRKVAAEEKLEKTLYELEATKNQLSDAEENLKVTKEEMDKYKINWMRGQITGGRPHGPMI